MASQDTKPFLAIGETCKLTARELYGLSLCLNRMGKRLDRISEVHSRAIAEGSLAEK